MCLLLCVCVFSCSCVCACVCACFHFFVLCYLSLSNVCTLSIVSTVHCALCPPVQVFIALCFPCLVCLLCVSCHDPVLVCAVCVPIVCRVCCDSFQGPGCVLHVVIVCSGCCFVIVRACVQRVKSGAFSHCKKYT